MIKLVKHKYMDGSEKSIEVVQYDGLNLKELEYLLFRNSLIQKDGTATYNKDQTISCSHNIEIKKGDYVVRDKTGNVQIRKKEIQEQLPIVSDLTDIDQIKYKINYFESYVIPDVFKNLRNLKSLINSEENKNVKESIDNTLIAMEEALPNFYEIVFALQESIGIKTPMGPSRLELKEKNKEKRDRIYSTKVINE